jgi:hypothetical protein
MAVHGIRRIEKSARARTSLPRSWSDGHVRGFRCRWSIAVRTSAAVGHLPAQFPSMRASQD